MTASRTRRAAALARAALLGAALGLALAFPSEAAQGARNAFDTFTHAVMPVLLPMMTLSLLIASRSRAHGNRAAVLLGLLSGSPGGARLAARWHGRRALRVAVMTGVTSPAFALFVVPAWLGDARLGGALLAGQWAGALGAGLMIKCPPDDTVSAEAGAAAPASLPQALRASADAMLTVCAGMMAFGALTGASDGLLSGAPLALRAALASMLEVTGGVRLVAQLGGALAPAMAGAALSMGGLSLAAQCMGFLAPRGVRFAHYLYFRVIAGLIAFAVTRLIVRVFLHG